MNKNYEDLTRADLYANKCWLYDHVDNRVKPIVDVIDFDTDMPYVTYVEYTLNNGKIFEGYMCSYDCSGNRIFIGDRSYSLSIYSNTNPVEAQVFCNLINAKADEVYPIQYRAFIKCFGNNTGSIEIRGPATI